MAKMDLDAMNRRWVNQATADLAITLDEQGYEEGVAALISDFERDGLIPEEIRDGVAEMIYQDLREAFESLGVKAEGLEWVLITLPHELHIDYGQIADAYLELLCKGPGNRKAKPSKNSRPKAKKNTPAKARNTTGRRRP